MSDTPKERRQIPLASATFKELRDFALNDMGVPEIKNGWSSKHIKEALIDAEWTQDYILGPEIEDAPAALAPAPAASDKISAPVVAPKAQEAGEPPQVPEPEYEINISQQEGAGGKRAVFVGVNGIGILLPRNKQIKVKRRYVEALRIAIQSTTELDEETGKQETKDMPSHPFSVVVTPPQAQIDAWLAWETFDNERTRRLEIAHDEAVRQQQKRNRAA